jgi:hypothetical protein
VKIVVAFYSSPGRTLLNVQPLLERGGARMGAGKIWRAVVHLIARAGAVAALFCVLGGVYWLLIRPAQLHWGATQDEVRRALPEDNLVTDPSFDATRAITIRGRPEDVWPWLVQMGYGRAGFYGYDLIENPGSHAGIRSARVIIPALQQPSPGDLLPLSVAATLQYGTVDRNRTLVWRGRGDPPNGVFLWTLAPIDARHTRLISRIRWRYLNDPAGRALGVFTEFADHVAVRAILIGLKDRVEGRTPASLTLQGAQITAWLLAFAELVACVVLIATTQRWGIAWGFGLIAGLVLFFCLYGPSPSWGTALVPWLYLALLLWARHRMRSRDRLGSRARLLEDQAVVRVP